MLSFRRDLATEHIFNGVSTARMKIKHDMPSTVRIVEEFIEFWYPGQPKSCRRCGDLDHLIKDCANVRCFNCERSGHRVEQWEERPMCSICHSTGYLMRECLYFLCSVNVVPVVSERASVPNSYAGAAKAPRTVVFNSTLSSTSKTAEDRGTKEKEKRVEKAKEKENVRSKFVSQSSSRIHERGRELHRERERDLERERGRQPVFRNG